MNPQQVDKWRSHVDTIQRDLGHALFHRTMFRDVTAMVKRNPEVDASSFFFGFLANVYFDSLLLTIRRQTKSGHSVSLRQLLTELEVNASQFTREWFASLYADSGAPAFLVASDFGRFAGPDAAHIDPALIASDIAALRSTCKAAETYVDKRIAHWDRTPPTMPLTVTDVDAAVDLLALLTTKYYFLLFCTSLEIHPIPQGPVYHVFTIPWWTPLPKSGA